MKSGRGTKFGADYFNFPWNRVHQKSSLNIFGARETQQSAKWRRAAISKMSEHCAASHRREWVAIGRAEFVVSNTRRSSRVPRIKWRSPIGQVSRNEYRIEIMGRGGERKWQQRGCRSCDGGGRKIREKESERESHLGYLGYHLAEESRRE